MKIMPHAGSGCWQLGFVYFPSFRIPSPPISVADPDPGSGAFLTPGSGMGEKSGPGSGIRNEQPGSYFLELRNHFFGLKYLNSLMRIRDKRIRIRDGKKSDPKSGKKIPDPQHCLQSLSLLDLSVSNWMSCTPGKMKERWLFKNGNRFI